MKKAVPSNLSRRRISRLIFFVLFFVFCTAFALAGQFGVYAHGTVVRMRMGDCISMRRGFMASFGPPQGQVAEACPEYTLVSDKVVYVIVGRSSDQLVPLADVIDFRLHDNEILVRLDDARHESKFSIKEMVLRSDWDMLQKRVSEQLNGPPADNRTGTRTQQ